MRILLNASTLRSGGGVQVASGFISNALRSETHDWLFVVSSAVLDNLPSEAVDDERIRVVDMHPRRPLAARKTRVQLDNLAHVFTPDLTFTILGPPYWSPRSTHVCGFAVPWVVFGGGAAWATVPVAMRPLVYANNLYRRSKLSRSWYYWMESEAGTTRLASKLRIDPGRTYVIPNCPHPVFLEQRWVGSPDGNSLNCRGTRAVFTVLCLSAYYPHKNLELVPEVAAQLVKRGRDGFVFQLTLPPEGRGWLGIARKAERLGVTDKVVNLGPQRIQDCPGLYAEADAAFLPTLLEVFSATYVESIIMRKPLVTTAIPPAREVCGPAALFFAPFDAAGASGHLVRLMTDQAFYQARVAACEAAAPSVISAEQKYRMTLAMLEDVHARSR